MDARNNIATDLFYKIRSRFQGLKLGAETGEITINPEDARFFDFDYMEGEKPIGHVSISLAEHNSLKVYFSHGITESMDDGQKDNWYKFLKELRMFAKRRLLNFDTRDIAKDNLDKRDYQFLSQNAQPKQTKHNTIQQPVGESVMAESAMYGTKNVSYQKLMDTRLIIKHSHQLNDDMAPGARSRNISALFVENQDGERFKYPFIHLAGARAMQRHVANGGVPYDDIGKSIVKMSEEIAQLKSFSNYVVRNDLMNSDTNSVVERSSQALNSLREQIKGLSKQGHYQQYKDSFQTQPEFEVPEDVIESFKDQFTVRSFKEDIASVFPVLYRLTQDTEVGYNDIVEMTAEQETDEEQYTLESKDEFDQFESWVMNLGEESAVQSQDPEEQQAAIQQLQELVSQEFPAGVDGENAIQSLKGLIDDPTLYNAIKEAASQNPEADMRGPVQQWLGLYAPDVLESLDFGDLEQQAATEQPATEDFNVTEGAGGDYEIDGEMATVFFERDANGHPVVTKVLVGSADITSIENLEEIAETIEPGDESPLEDVYTLLSIDVDTEYNAAERGSRERGTGLQMEPDYDAYTDITDIIAYGNGTKVKLYTDDLPPSAQEQLQSIADSITQSQEDDFNEPDDNYDDRYESVNPHNPRDYERPAVDRKAKGHPPLRMQDVRAKDTEHKRNFQDRTNGSREMNVKEVAEFIHSFYDKESGTFPKGPEGVATMVGKKFGERAEHAARKMVERMAPQQTTENNPKLSELARIKELSGLK